MKVYNLTNGLLDYRGKLIPPRGGSLEYPELDVFIADRDRKLAQAGVISFGQLPKSWLAVETKKVEEKPVPLALKELAPQPEDEVKVETKKWR